MRKIIFATLCFFSMINLISPYVLDSSIFGIAYIDVLVIITVSLSYIYLLNTINRVPVSKFMLYCFAVLLLVYLISLISGLFYNPVSSVLFEARLFTFAIALSILVAHAELGGLTGERGHSIAKYVIIFMGMIFLYRFSLYSVNPALGEFWASNDAESQFPRLFNSNQSMVILIASAYLFHNVSRINNAGLYSSLGVVLVIFSQQRTVWLIGLLTIAYLFIRHNFNAKILTRTRSTIYLAVVAISAVYFADQVSYALGLASASYFEILRPNSTLQWRIQGWIALFQNKEYASLVIGSPFGSGYDRYIHIFSQDVSTKPHNFYLEMLLRLGFVGFGSIMLIITLAFRRTAGHKFSKTIIVMMLIFFITYSPDLSLMIVFIVSLISLMRMEETWKE